MFEFRIGPLANNWLHCQLCKWVWSSRIRFPNHFIEQRDKFLILTQQLKISYQNIFFIINKNQKIRNIRSICKQPVININICQVIWSITGTYSEPNADSGLLKTLKYSKEIFSRDFVFTVFKIIAQKSNELISFRNVCFYNGSLQK